MGRTAHAGKGRFRVRAGIVRKTAAMEAAEREATERWFVRRGLPHAIEDYTATGDVFTRATPVLGAVFFLEVFASFDDRFQGWKQAAAFAGGVAIMVGAVVVMNWLRGRRAFQRPDDVGVIELGLFVLVPALLPVLFSDEPGTRFLVVVGVNLLVLAVTYVMTSYGLVPMVAFGARQVRQRFGQLGQLVARGLPMLLLFTTFVFLNAEMWQVASDFAPIYYGVVLGFLVLAAVGFVALRAPREVANLGRFPAWGDVIECASRTDAPIAHRAPTDPSGAVDTPPLERSDRINLGLLVVIAQMVQVALVAAVIGAVYVGFGLLAVRRATIEQWTTAAVDPLATFHLAGSEIIVTWEHFAVAGFIAVFSGLQFAVAMLTDAAYRDEFYDDVTGEIREVLAVRAIYHDALQRPA